MGILLFKGTSKKNIAQETGEHHTGDSDVRFSPSMTQDIEEGKRFVPGNAIILPLYSIDRISEEVWV